MNVMMTRPIRRQINKGNGLKIEKRERENKITIHPKAL
jgi:hypothetical protein